MSERAPFDPAAPVPHGLTLLEASAGAGKTHCMTTLWLRLVLDEGLRPEEVVTVTFTNAAASELQLRLRSRLECIWRDLRDGTPGTRDPWTSNHWSSNDPEAAGRVLATLDALEASPVGTLHELARRGLRALALEPSSSAEPLDPAARARRLGDAFWARLCLAEPDVLHDRALRAGLGPKSLTDIARAALDAPLAPVVLRDGLESLLLAPGTALKPREPGAVAMPEVPVRPLAATETLPELLACFLDEVRATLSRELREGRFSTPNAAPERLLAAVTDPTLGDSRRASLRALWRAALVDEFQDTDAIQWALLERLFMDPPAEPSPDPAAPRESAPPGPAKPAQSLVLIGDPKQAIYSFRQADLALWHAAAARVDHLRTLHVNRRADGALVAALNGLLDAPLSRAAFAAQGLSAAPVAATQPASRLPVPHAPLGVVLVTRSNPTRRALSSPDLDALALSGLSHAIARLEASGALAPGGTRSVGALGPGSTPDRLARLSGCAVLVRTHRQAEAVRAHLLAMDIPCSSVGVSSIFRTLEARDLARVFQAVLAPHNTPSVKGALVTDLFGHGPQALAADAERGGPLLASAAEALRALGTQWQRDGFYPMFRAFLRLLRHGSLTGRRPPAESLARLETLGALLHGEVSRSQRAASRLVAWLEARILSADSEAAPTLPQLGEAPLDGVRILTVHTAKGLEFPFVFLPFAWQPPYSPGQRGLATVVRDSLHGRRIELRLSSAGPHAHGPDGAHPNGGQDTPPPAEEDLRLLYVALTRARHGVTLIVPPQARNWNFSSLALLLGGDLGGPQADPARARRELGRLDPQALARHLQALLPAPQGEVLLLHRADGELVLVPTDSAAPPAPGASAPPTPEDLSAAPEILAPPTIAGPVAAQEILGPPTIAGPVAAPVMLAPPSIPLPVAAPEMLAPPTIAGPVVAPDAPSSGLPTDRAEPSGPAAPAPSEPHDAEASTRAAAPARRTWTRSAPLDLLWRRSSFSALTREFAGLGAAHEVATPGADEPEDPTAAPDHTPIAPAPLTAPTSARGPSLDQLPGGALLGNAVHRVLEHHDFTDPDPATLAPRAARALRDHGLAPDLAPAVAEALADALRTPLPVPPAPLPAPDAPDPGFRLADLPRSHRLSELGFMLALVGGSHSSREPATGRLEVTASDLADTLRRDAPPALHPWLDSLARQPMRPLRGLLSGSIDAIVRSPRDGRYFLIDWKTNRLGATLSDYAPEALWRAMDHHHYHLQYLLYAIAFRRYLRLRDPEAPPSAFGGVLYCFLRGMHPDNPAGTGVFAFHPPEAMLDGLDALLGPAVPGSARR